MKHLLAFIITALCGIASATDYVGLHLDAQNDPTPFLAGESLKLPTASGGFTVTLGPGAQTGSFSATLPVLAASRTLAVIDQAQTFTAAQTITLADGATGLRVGGATGKMRYRGYVDATFGAIIDSSDAAEAGYLPFTLTGNPLRLTGNGTLQLVIASTATLSGGNSTSVASITGASLVTAGLQANGTGAAGASIGISRWVAAANAGFLFFGKSRGGSVGTFGIVGSADTLGTIEWHGDDGTQMRQAGSQRFVTDGAPSTTSMPGKWILATTPAGAVIAVDRLSVDNAGNISQTGTGTFSTGTGPVSLNGTTSLLGAANTWTATAYAPTSTSGSDILSNWSVSANPASASSSAVFAGVFTSQSNASCAQNLTSSSGLVGIQSTANHFGSGTATAIYGGRFIAQARAAGGAVTSAIGLVGSVNNLSANTVSIASDFRADIITNTGGGVVSRAASFHSNQQTVGATANHAFFHGTGNSLAGTGNWCLYNNTADANYLGTGATGVGIATFVGSEKMRVSGGTIATPTATDVMMGGGSLSVGANLTVAVVGGGILVKEGTNATSGVATLVAGTVVVSTTKVTANSRIYLTTQNASGTVGFVQVSARTASTSFTILSSSALDTSAIAWLIVEPAP